MNTALRVTAYIVAGRLYAVVCVAVDPFIAVSMVARRRNDRY